MYSQTSLKLHKLPITRPREDLGLVRTNGIGKSKALKILAGKTNQTLAAIQILQTEQRS
jgi:translation initiation factor RLI1